MSSPKTVGTQGAIQKLRGQDEGGGCQKMSVFVQA